MALADCRRNLPIPTIGRNAKSGQDAPPTAVNLGVPHAEWSRSGEPSYQFPSCRDWEIPPTMPYLSSQTERARGATRKETEFWEKKLGFGKIG